MKNNKIMVSVCVITFNHEKYIEQCIESITSQIVDFDYEIIIGDDFSNDKTAEIIRNLASKYSNKIKAVFREKNVGGVKNYVDIHQMASGRYVAHLDGDDFWHPNKLAQQINFLEQHQECSAAYSNAFVFDHLGRNTGKFNKIIPSVFDRNFLLQNGNFLNASSLIYRRKFQREILPRDHDFIDYQIHLHCSLLGDLGYINEPLVSYRVLFSGIALKSTRKIVMLYWIAILEAFRSDGKTPAVHTSITDFMGTVFCRAIIEKDPSTAKKWINTIHAETKISKNYIIIFGLLKATAKIVNSAKKRLLRSLNMPVTFASR